MRRKGLTRRRALWFSVAVLATTSVTAVLACGPFFPEPLLSERTASLQKLSVFSFSREIAQIFPTPPKPVPRATTRGDEAEAEALYAKGARDYQAYDDPENTDRGLTAFEAVIALPESQNAHKKVAAAFMAGKAHMARAFLPDADRDHELADAARDFALTRSLVAAGWHDPDSLGPASWGEEARLYLRDAKGLCGWQKMAEQDACTDGLDAASIRKALVLYTHQASEGSYGGEESLRFVLGWAVQDGDLVTALAADPFSRKLLSLYALSFDYDLELGQTALKNLALAVQQQGATAGDGSDWLAAAAYRQGQFDLARIFAIGNPSPLAAWVRAKIAVRANDIPVAVAAYAEAVRGFLTLPTLSDPKIEARLRGEQGVLALSRGEFVQAFGYLYAAAQKIGTDSDVAFDASYVAERVLTIDELKLFVDGHIPARAGVSEIRTDGHAPADVASDANLPDDQAHKDMNDTGPSDSGTADATIGKGGWDEPASATTEGKVVRDILVRRLIRANRFDEALTYSFHSTTPQPSLTEDPAQLDKLTYDQLIRAYAQSLSDAKTRWSATERAKAWWRAALIARRYGMELMGTEQAPDYMVYGGSFGSGPNIDPTASDKSTSDALMPSEGTQSPPLASSFRYIQPQEQARFRQSAAIPNERFHYRWVAVSYAVKAADLLPPRSQAFAAVLCQAAGWHTDRTEALYRRYVHHGAYVPFAVNFGKSCDVTPNFDGTRFFTLRREWRRIRNMISHRL